MAMARAAERCMSDFKAQELANTAWAFAKAGQSDVQLFVAMASEVKRLMDNFSAQELVNIAWAFVTVGPLEDQQMQVARVGEFGCCQLTTVTQGVACGEVGKWMDTLFCALSRVAE